jgi:transcriptional regulator with XRE-family HTH domain
LRQEVTGVPAKGIGASLRAARERRSWSRETLAHAAGLSWAAVVQIESGRRADVRLSSLLALADALEVSLDELAGRPTRPLGGLVHRALFYDGHDDFLAAAVPYLREGVARDERPLAVATAAQLRGLKAQLGRDAKKVTLADSATWYDSPSAALMRYRAYLDDVTSSGARTVRVLGEPVWSKRSAASVKAWVRYESLVNLVFANASASLVCPYDLRHTPQHVIASARRTHPQVVTVGGPAAAAAASEDYVPPEDLLLER